MRSNKRHLHFIILVLWVFLCAGCTGQFLAKNRPPETLRTDRFVMVTTAPGDTFASLAATYLKDKDKAWQIAAFNPVEDLAPGKRIVIPLVPLNRGGLQKNGYQTVPVLLYTDLGPSSPKSQSASARGFQRQLDYLRSDGYVTISLDLLHGFLELEDQLPPRAIVISFDSTDAWVHDVAFPALQQRGMWAAIFIDPEEVGRKGRLNWEQLAEMTRSGWSIGLLGPSIKAPAKEDVKACLESFEAALVRPQEAFRHHLKQPCRYYAYPQGESNDLTIAMLKKHGYAAAFTRKRGSNPFFVDNYQIKRSVISGQYNLDRFRQNLAIFRSAELQ
jgi:peptidoglycan/xylan/chitin deacetylase (PgdA/CDA1 family)